jgi:hypothetical protein
MKSTWQFPPTLQSTNMSGSSCSDLGVEVQETLLSPRSAQRETSQVSAAVGVGPAAGDFAPQGSGLQLARSVQTVLGAGKVAEQASAVVDLRNDLGGASSSSGVSSSSSTTAGATAEVVLVLASTRKEAEELAAVRMGVAAAETSMYEKAAVCAIGGAGLVWQQQQQQQGRAARSSSSGPPAAASTGAASFSAKDVGPVSGLVSLGNNSSRVPSATSMLPEARRSWVGVGGGLGTVEEAA